MLATEAWPPESDPWSPHKGGRRELTPQSCSLTCILPALTPSHTHDSKIKEKTLTGTGEGMYQAEGMLCALEEPEF